MSEFIFLFHVIDVAQNTLASLALQVHWLFLKFFRILTIVVLGFGYSTSCLARKTSTVSKNWTRKFGSSSILRKWTPSATSSQTISKSSATGKLTKTYFELLFWAKRLICFQAAEQSMQHVSVLTAVNIHEKNKIKITNIFCI